MNSSKSFSLQLLGSPSLADPGGSIVSGRAVQRHRLALLALLALAPGGGLSRDKLLGYLWPESDVERARQLLNQAVYHLRKTLGEAAILSGTDELRLNPEVIESDVGQFEDALAQRDYARAVALYRGPFLDGFFVSDAPEFERWTERERQRLAGAHAKALEALAETADAKGDFAGAVEWWNARAALDPYDSRVALRLMQSLEANGNRAGALQHAAIHARLLDEEFGIAPPPEVEALAERLRQEAAESRIPNRPVRAAAAAEVTPTSTSGVRQPTQSDSAPLATPASAAAVPAAPIEAERGASRVASKGRRAGYALTAVVAAVIGASVFWLLGRDTDARWLNDQALPQIEKYLDVADWESAYTLALEAERRVPESEELADLWTRISWRVTLHSDPEGARVFRQAYGAPGDRWEELGRTPLVDIRFPYGLSRLRLEREGNLPLLRALGGAHLNWAELTQARPDGLLVGPDTFRLDTEKTLPRGMVRVPGWTFRSGGKAIPMRDFFLGRYEVTNAEYKAFVDAGGYQRPELWDPIVLKGDTLPWSEAMTFFVDRTGRRGPSTWEAGDYPQGRADFPVSGVSWYEAAAYARFAEGELPTAHHWQEALANSMFPWLLPVSNFSGEGPRAVTASHAMSHVGAFDLAGNVREWTSSRIGSERIILGGSWNDPYYIAGTADASALPEDRSAGNGIRLAKTFDEPEIAAHVRAPIEARTTASPVVRQQPVSNEVFAAYSRVFDYDRGPLNPVIEKVDTTRLWISERVRFAAGYGGERMLLHLYLPRTGGAPYQTVVYWPGWDTFALDDADLYFAKQLDFIVKSGRAVAFPIYRGIFERRVGGERRRAEFGSAEYRDNTIFTVKDLRRAIDYLETRRDIDRDAIAFFGYSWGGVNGPTAMAQEPRIRVGVIDIGLLPPMSATPEVDPVNALPRVRVPTLMLSGEFDPMVPRENSERYFALIGVPPSKKRHVVAMGGHFVPRDLLIRETLDWLDTHLGPVRR